MILLRTSYRYGPCGVFPEYYFKPQFSASWGICGQALS